MALPPPASIPALTTSELTSLVAQLFEHSPELVALLESSPFFKQISAYQQFTVLVHGLLRDLVPATADLDAPLLDSILGSHPRLGAPKPESLSAASRSEQAQLQSTDSPEARQQAQKLAQLNKDYELRFPGLRYVVFVNGRPRPVIMEDMQRRISHSDRKTERVEAIQAMCDIANDRVAKLGAADNLASWRSSQK